MRLGINGQDLWLRGALRRSVAGKDMNTEGEESTALAPVTNQSLVNTQQTKKTKCTL
jgi:hypothetical protein